MRPTSAVVHRELPSNIRSSGFALVSSGKSENADSIRSRSHITRPSTRLGRGIRPSATISSNLVAPTPTYRAASSRDRPRGGYAMESIRVMGNHR
jgi:hypothetical protein